MNNIKKIKIGGNETYPNTVLESNDLDEIKSYIERELEIEKIEKKLPGLNCGDCGYENCRIMAENIYYNKNKIDDCKHIKEKNITIFVNGNKVYLNDFVQKIFINTITGMIKSLKGVDDVNSFQIFYK